MKLALRQLLKNPGFTLVAILTLALGIGANTAIFSVVDQLLVRPLPVPQPQRLALLAQAYRPGYFDHEFNYPLYRDYQRENHVFSHLTATAEHSVGLGIDGTTERQQALLVSGNYFAMLGLNAALGRTFATNEGVELDDAPVVVLSHALWQKRFAADPAVLNRSVNVNGRPFTIIGVAPRDFTGTTRSSSPDLYLPITMFGQLTSDRPGNEHPLATRFFLFYSIMGRLKEGVSHDQAQAAMLVLAHQADAAQVPNTSTNLVVLPGAQGFANAVRDTRLPLKLLFGTAGLVLLIACANLANLQLARATKRTREFAIRLALGARRGRLIRELLTESLLLSLAGGGLGLLIAVWLVRVLERFRPPAANVFIDTSLDSRVLLFALGASIFTGLLFGLAPAWRASRPAIIPQLKNGGGALESGLGRWNLRSALVVLQVSLSLLVMISAGLCTRSLQKLQRINPGFEPSRMVLMSFDLGLNNYGMPQANDFYERLLERTRTLPGVESASLSANTPLSGNMPGMSVERVEGYKAAENEHPVGDINYVAHDYFRTLGVPLARGRTFNTTDRANAQPVVIINDAFARRYFERQDPIGKRIFQHGPDGSTPTEVVGVVESTRNRLTDQARPMMYFPLTQKPDLRLTLTVRTGLNPASTIGQLRGVVKSLDAAVPIFHVRTMAQQKDGSLALQRMAATLLGGFGILALLLAALGIYGVLAYSISCRTREIGVRMAIGAQISDVIRLVLKQGLGLAAVGLALGLIGAFGTTRLLRGFLHEVQPLDPVTFTVVIGVLGLVTLLACWLPARRASRVNPMEALRAE